MGRASVLCVVVAFLTCGCKKPPTDDKPEATADQLYAEQERIQKGEVVGEPLRAPKVVVDATRVTVNGHLVVTRSELGVPDWRVQKLFSWAKGLREHWKMIHPGESFQAAADITLPPDCSFVEGATVAKTLAYAGYGPNQTFHSGPLTTRIDFTVPGPPHFDEEPKPKPKTLELCRGESWKARSKIPLIDPPPIRREEQGYAYSPWASAGPNTVQEPIAELCANGCAAIEIGNASTFQEALSVASAARAANTRVPLTVSFTRCSLEETPPPLPPVSNGMSKLRVGAVAVSGSLSPEAVTGVLSTVHPFVQQCYETALTRNPVLAGRASTKVVIDETGAVVMATNAGSDIADGELVACVVKQFLTLRFPKPEKGLVAVTYPLFLEANKFNSKRDGG